MLPERAQFAACWRWLDKALPPDQAWTAPYLPLLRKVEKQLGGMEPFQRAVLCLEVFAERGAFACGAQRRHVYAAARGAAAQGGSERIGACARDAALDCTRHDGGRTGRGESEI